MGERPPARRAALSRPERRRERRHLRALEEGPEALTHLAAKLRHPRHLQSGASALRRGAVRLRVPGAEAGDGGGEEVEDEECGDRREVKPTDLRHVDARGSVRVPALVRPSCSRLGGDAPPG